MSLAETFVRILNENGAEPGSSIHSWRCESEACTCVEDLARELAITAARA